MNLWYLSAALLFGIRIHLIDCVQQLTDVNALLSCVSQRVNAYYLLSFLKFEQFTSLERIEIYPTDSYSPYGNCSPTKELVAKDVARVHTAPEDAFVRDQEG